MIARVSAASGFTFGSDRFPCALGRSGIDTIKREGDGRTPAGTFALREVFYRAGRLQPPTLLLPHRALSPDDGWCDDPDDTAYNQAVKLPYSGRHENLWREDGLYDLFAVIGYNDAPVQPGLGSAIFLHVAKTGYAPTEGCVALAMPDLVHVLAQWHPDDRLVIEAA